MRLTMRSILAKLVLLSLVALVSSSAFRSGASRWNLQRARAQSSQCRGGTKLEHLKGECMLHWECLGKKGVSIGPCFTSGSVGSCCMIDSTTPEASAVFPVISKPTRSPNSILPEKEKPEKAHKKPSTSFPTTVTSSTSGNTETTPFPARKNVTKDSMFGDAHDFWVAGQQVAKPGDEKATPNNFRCGVRPLRPTARVVGGRNAKVGEWPWHVLIKEAGFLGLFMKPKCGGVLIDDRWVLTAAHCQPSVMGSLVVMLGQHDTAGRSNEHKPQIKTVKRMIVHRDYNPETFDNDIALLELDVPFEMQPNVVPICLPEADKDLVGLYGHVSGFGKLSYGGMMPNILQTVKLPIIANDKCQKMFADAGHYKFIGNNFVCAGYPQGGKDSCEGDSGGPLMMEHEGVWTLVGTVSHGIKCAEPNMPGVYMKTFSYLNWIKSVIGQNGQK